MVHEIERGMLGKLLSRQGMVVNVGDSEGEIIQLLRSDRPDLVVHDAKAEITLDEFCAGSQIRRVSLLNLDVQGRELERLRGAVGLLRRQRIDLIRFTHGSGFARFGANLYELFAFLIPFRYRLFKMTPEGFQEKREIVPAEEVQAPCSYLVVAERLVSGMIGGGSILDVPRLFAANRIEPRGVIHVGAHLGEERELYRRMGFKKILFVEANPELSARLAGAMANDPAVVVAHCAVSDLNGTATLHITSLDQSSSILPLKRHREIYPKIEETGQVEVPSKRLDTLLGELKLSPGDFNYLHLDIQGAELRALRGATDLLKGLDAVATEVNFEELYEGCGLIEEIDDLLESGGFQRRAVACPYHPSWGDAFYSRRGDAGRVAGAQVLSLSTLGHNGRFANQIFQYAFGRILAEQQGLNLQTPAWVGQKLFGHGDAAISVRLPQAAEGRDFVEGVFPTGLFDAPPQSFDLWGYFQYDSVHYAPNRELFRSLFRPVASVEKPLREAIERLRAGGRAVVGLHLRRGDYGYRQFFVAPTSWYLEVLRKIWPGLNDPVLFIASDEPGKVLGDFKEFNPVTSKDLGLELSEAPFYADFYLMSQCDVLCIANSSFSFAASLLNERGLAFYRPHLGLKQLIAFEPWNSPPLLNCEHRLPLPVALSAPPSKAPTPEAVKDALGKFDANAADATAIGTLQDIRRLLAEHFVNLPPEQLEQAYLGGPGQHHKAMVKLSQLPANPRDAGFAQAVVGSIGNDPRRLIAAMLYRRADELGLPASLEIVPSWLRETYLRYVLMQPQVFGEIGQVDRYHEFLGRWVDYLHEHALGPSGGQSNLFKSALIQFTQVNNFIPLYFCSSNLKGILSKRADLIEEALRITGHEIDFTFSARSPGREKIRVGILAAGFSSSTETFHTLPLYEHVDRSKIEVILFGMNSNNNAMEQYCRGRADRMVHLSGQFPEQVARLRSEDLDVLVVGTNVTALTNGVAVLATHRVARVQMTLFSSPATSGIRNMDYFLSGKLSERKDAQDHYRERLIQLEGTGFCFRYEAISAPAMAHPTRKEANLADDAVVFVSGANFFKIIPELIESWAKIIAGVPNSVLMLYPFGPAWSDTYAAMGLVEQINRGFARHGLDQRRLLLTKTLPNRATVKEVLKMADVYLDSIRHAGGHSLIDPLEVGLPAVTVEGEFLRNRHGAAILRAIDAGGLVAADEAEYVRRAIELGKDVALRRRWREHILGAMKRGPSFLDSHAFGARMTEVYARVVGDSV